MPERQSTFDMLSALDSPKVRGVDRRGVHGWTKFYSAFSESFATSALQELCLKYGEVILDPFVGSGTTIVAACKLGIPAIGVDLDPTAALLSRAKIAVDADACSVLELLSVDKKVYKNRSFSEKTGKTIFTDEDLRYARGVIDNIQKKISLSGALLWEKILDDPKGRYDSECIALTSLAIASFSSSKIKKGSNPVWSRIVEDDGRHFPPMIEKFSGVAAKRLISDLAKLKPLLKGRDVRIINKNIYEITDISNCINGVVTSPPYPNRLDYIVNHLAPLSVLGNLIGIDIDELRCKMIGTTKIISKIPPDKEWGLLCNNILSEVVKHPSKGSRNYYYWNFVEYFRSSYNLLLLLKKMCCEGSAGFYVVQTSFYKEILIPTPQIISEMASNLGINTLIRREEIIKSHIGQLNPKSKVYSKGNKPKESIIKLTF